MDIQELSKARQQVVELEKQMLEEVREKAGLLGMALVANGDAPTKQLKRKRRTRAEIAADNASAANG